MKDATTNDWKSVRESIRQLNMTLDKVEEQLTGRKRPAAPLPKGFEDMIDAMFSGKGRP